MEHNRLLKLVHISLISELTDSEQSELVEHLKTCDECRKELERQKEVLSLIGNKSKPEVSDNLLREARSQLRGALRMQRAKQDSRLFEKIAGFISTPVKFSLAAAALLLAGLLMGSLLFGNKQVMVPGNDITKVSNEFSSLQNDVSVKNVSFLDSDASDGEIEFTFDAVKHFRIKGSVDNPAIQNVLTYSMLNDQNPGSRLNSINAIDSDNKVNIDKDFKGALLTVMMTDKNPGIRREALKLVERINYDEEVKSAFIYVLLNDSSTAMRIDALNYLLELNKKGGSLNYDELQTIRAKAVNDNNGYIKLKTKTLLQEYN